MTFIQRKMIVKITKAGSTTTLQNLRMHALVTENGVPSGSNLELAIYGLSLSRMNDLSNVGVKWTAMPEYHIVLLAGDDKSGMEQVFSGVVFTAMVDAQSMPDVCFRITGQPDGQANVKPVPPTTIKGTGDAAQMMEKMAKQAGFTFENNGVKIKLSNPYFSGSIGAQMRALARHAGVDLLFENGKVIIVPPAQSRGGESATLSPQTGLVGYPSFSSNHIFLKSIFNTKLRALNKVTVKSDLTAACGTFKILTVEHELECLMPRGAWFTHLDAQKPDYSSGAQEPPTDGK